MKKLTLLITMLMAISGCSNEGPTLVERGGIYYEVDSQTPFTGSSVSYHENGQLEHKAMRHIWPQHNQKQGPQRLLTAV